MDVREWGLYVRAAHEDDRKNDDREEAFAEIEGRCVSIFEIHKLFLHKTILHHYYFFCKVKKTDKPLSMVGTIGTQATVETLGTGTLIFSFHPVKCFCSN